MFQKSVNHQWLIDFNTCRELYHFQTRSHMISMLLDDKLYMLKSLKRFIQPSLCKFQELFKDL